MEDRDLFLADQYMDLVDLDMKDLSLEAETPRWSVIDQEHKR